MRGAWRAVVVLGLSLAVSGCRKGVPAPEAVDPVSMAEAEELARRFEAAMQPCVASSVDALIDFETILRRTVGTADAPRQAKEGFLGGARRTKNTVGTQLCQGMDADHVIARYELLRIREVGGQPRPLFRILLGDNLNYHELHLGKSRTDHQIRVLDIYAFTSGELMSETLAHMFEHSIASASSGASIERAGATLKHITAAQASGDLEEVRRLLATLPANLRNAKPLRLIELNAASELDDATYVELIERYERSFPGDASLDMVSIDGYYLRKDGPAALAAVERLDRRVDGDPYLGLLRASALMLDPTPANLTDAERWAKVTTDELPANENGWWTLASVLLLRHDHAAAAAVFELLETEFDTFLDLESMGAEPIYASFLGSPEFEAWWLAREHRDDADDAKDAVAGPAHHRPQ